MDSSHTCAVIAPDPLTLRRLERVIARGPGLVVAFAATSGQIDNEGGPSNPIRASRGPIDVAAVSLDDVGPSAIDRLEAWVERLTPRYGVVILTPTCPLAVTCRLARLGVRHHLVAPARSEVLIERLSACLPREAQTDEAPDEPAVQPRVQREVDLVLHAAIAMSPPRAWELPKGFSARTLEVVLAGLRRIGPATAMQLAAATGLSRVSVRRYLELLESNGTVSAECVYGARGRPAIRYELALAGLPV